MKAWAKNVRVERIRRVLRQVGRKKQTIFGRLYFEICNEKQAFVLMGLEQSYERSFTSMASCDDKLDSFSEDWKEDSAPSKGRVCDVQTEAHKALSVWVEDF